MTDFLSNLLLRNVADASAGPILRPRLPSLFEPLQRMDQAGSPLEESFPPDNPSSTSGIRPADEPGDPPSVIPNQASRRTSPATDPSFDSNAMKRIQTPETTRDTGDQIHAVRPVSSYEDPQRTIFYRDPEDTFARQNLPSHENHSHESHTREKGPRTETNPIRVQAAGENPLPAMLIAQPFETKSSHPKEKGTVMGKVPSVTESFQIRASLKPITSLSAIPADSQPTGREETSSPQTQPPVVEIHIGRVEIRAVPPAPKAKPALQPNTPRLSLDDYLRFRSGEKQ